MIQRFFSYYKPHKRLFTIDFSCAIVVAVLELAFPFAVQSFIDDLLPDRNLPLIIVVSIGLLMFYMMSTFLQYIVNYWGHKLGINIETDMRQQLFEHVQNEAAITLVYHGEDGIIHLSSDLESLDEYIFLVLFCFQRKSHTVSAQDFTAFRKSFDFLYIA